MIDVGEYYKIDKYMIDVGEYYKIYRYGHINVSTFYDPYQAHTSGGPI